MAKTQEWTKDEKNVSATRNTTIRGLAKNKTFNQGYRDYNRGVWAKDFGTMVDNDGWRYERGRLYAAAGGPPIKNQYDGRALRNDALLFIQDMIVLRTMI